MENSSDNIGKQAPRFGEPQWLAMTRALNHLYVELELLGIDPPELHFASDAEITAALSDAPAEIHIGRMLCGFSFRVKGGGA